jgi:hypothetical protein
MLGLEGKELWGCGDLWDLVCAQVGGADAQLVRDCVGVVDLRDLFYISLQDRGLQVGVSPSVVLLSRAESAWLREKW